MRSPAVRRRETDGAARPGEPAGAGPWWLRRWPRAAAAVAAGALPALAFPAPGLWWFAWVALVPWLLLIRTAVSGRRAALDGWLGGAGFMLAAHHWLMPSLHVFILVLAALLGTLWAPWGWLVRSVFTGAASPARALGALVVVPAGWLMVELVRSWQGLGGPWGLLGASQWEVTPALRLASVGGVWLVSLLVVAANTAVALVLAVERARAVGAVALLAGAVAVGAVAFWVRPPQPDGRFRVAVVQPGVVEGAGSPVRRFAREEQLTRELAGRHPDLVVWGESSVGADLATRPDLSARLAALSGEVGAPVLVNVDARSASTRGGARSASTERGARSASAEGSTRPRPGIYKSSVLVGPDGPTGDRYDKMRLVPFGEYVPARSLLGWATSVGKAAGEDRMRGTRPVVMTLPGARGTRIGPLVCFETAFPDMSRQLAARGARVLVAQSSTSTFQHSWAPAQHASLGALRAAETGRPMVHATLTGISAAYGPDGARVGRWLGTDRSAAAVYDLPMASGTTLYTRLGDWPVYGSVAALAVWAGAGAARRLVARRRGPRRTSFRTGRPARSARPAR